MPRDAAFCLGFVAGQSCRPARLGALLRVCLAACVLTLIAMPAFASKPKTKAKPSKPTAGSASGGKAGKVSSAGKVNNSGKHGHGKPAVMLERHVAGTKDGLPNVQALGALVIDENGHELFSRNPDRERPIASVSKLAAVLVVMDRDLELDGLSTISKTDSEVARGGARSRLLEGMTVSNRDLLHAALLGSDNRAIPALGRAVKLTPSQLAAAMTAKAKELGLVHTRFHDPTGLSPENVSTPRDTIVLLRTVMKQPVLAAITHRLTYEAHPVGRPPLTYNNTYKPAIRRGVEVLAGKTGYNDEARYCLVIATRIGGQNYFMSFLSNEGKLTRFGDVARVADWILQHKTKNPAEQVASTPAAPTPLMPTATAPGAPTSPGPLTIPNASPASPPGASPGAPVSPSVSPGVSPSVSPSAPVPTTSDAHVPTAAGMAFTLPVHVRVARVASTSTLHRAS